MDQRLKTLRPTLPIMQLNGIFHQTSRCLQVSNFSPPVYDAQLLLKMCNVEAEITLMTSR